PAAAGGFAPADAAANLDRFAGDDFWTRIADLGRIGVHDPGHGLLVGAQVGGHHVLPRADNGADFFGIAASDALFFTAAELGRVAGDAAFGPAERQAHNAALPRHPHRQGGHFAEVHRGVI